MAPERLNQSGF